MAKEKNEFPDIPADGIEIKNGMPKFDFMLSLFDGKRVELTFSWKDEGGKQITKKFWCRFYRVQEEYCREYGHDSRNYWIGEVRIFNNKTTEHHCDRFYTLDTKTRTGTIGKEALYRGGFH